MTDDTKRFKTHNDMPALMGTAHHKPSGRRHIPTMSRHVSLWMPDALEQLHTLPKDFVGPVTKDEERNLSGKERQMREAWILRIERFILEIYDALKRDSQSEAAKPTLTNFMAKDKSMQGELGLLKNFYAEDERQRNYDSPKEIEGNFRHETVRINGVWQSMPIEVTVELHTEYFTFSTSIDLGRNKTDKPWLYNSGTYRDVRKALDTINEVVGKRYEVIAEGKGRERKEKDRVDLQQAYATLYRSKPEEKSGIWAQLRDEIFGPALEKAGPPAEVGRVFSDMRGLTVRRGINKNDFITTAHPVEAGLPPSPSLAQIIEGQPFGGNNTARKKRMADIIRHVDAFTPFMLADVRLEEIIDGRPALEQAELSFSTIFSEHGFHISSVSLQNPSQDAIEHITPLTFINVMTRGEVWQIGRLVDIGNRLNTLRLAALYGYEQMTRANVDLHDIERRLNALQRDLSDKLEKEDGGTEVLDVLKKIVRDTATITAMVPGGASYRGERSEYYRAQYAEQIARLKLGVIPGLQNFEQTVGRRLGPLYELIHQTRLRLGRINDTVKEIDSKIQAEESVKAQRQTASLQENAERAFWFALFPYYSSSFLLHNVIGEKNLEEIDKGLDALMSSRVFNEHHLTEIIIAMPFFLAGIDGALKFPVAKTALGGIAKAGSSSRKIAERSVKNIILFKKYSSDLLQRKSKRISVKCKYKRVTLRQWANQKAVLAKDRVVTKPINNLKQLKKRYLDKGKDPS